MKIYVSDKDIEANDLKNYEEEALKKLEEK